MPEQTLFVLLNKQTDREGQHSFVLYNFVYTVCGGPCHLYRLQTVFWDLFLPSRTDCLFSYGGKKKHISGCLYYFLLDIVNIKTFFVLKNTENLFYYDFTSLSDTFNILLMWL